MPSSESEPAPSVESLSIREGMDGITPSRIRTLYRRAPLHRPVRSLEDIQRMYENATLVLSAWNEGHLAGVARVMTDWVLYSYLCDLAVEPDVQGLGVGKRLIEEIRARCPGTDLMLRDSDLSTGFYEHLGFDKVDNAWISR